MQEEMADEVDRLSIRTRPPGSPVIYQTWGKLLFMHWPIPAQLLRPLIPARLVIDTFDGEAWIGVIPFTMWDVRPVFLPAVPGLSESHELNVRTYVHLDGVPGVWFFSLDAASRLMVWAARFAFHLPYFSARMKLKQEGNTIYYSSSRTDRNGPPAQFDATWAIGAELPESEPGSLVFFLTERYCLYSARGNNLYRARIFHDPWRLRRAELPSYQSSMIESQGLPSPEGDPLLHYAESMHVKVWPLAKL